MDTENSNIIPFTRRCWWRVKEDRRGWKDTRRYVWFFTWSWQMFVVETVRLLFSGNSGSQSIEWYMVEHILESVFFVNYQSSPTLVQWVLRLLYNFYTFPHKVEFNYIEHIFLNIGQTQPKSSAALFVIMIKRLFSVRMPSFVFRSGWRQVQALPEQKNDEQRHQNCDDVIKTQMHDAVFWIRRLPSSERLW